MQNLLLIFVFFVVAALSFIGGIYFNKTQEQPDASLQEKTSDELRQSGYKYINPLLECEIAQSIAEREYKPSREKIESYINDQKNKGLLVNTSVYWRDLNNGPWFGINEREGFYPASLLKLPYMMAYYLKAQDDPEILKKELVFEKSSLNKSQFFMPTEKLEPGKTYTVDELIYRMIAKSDNDALSLLSENITPIEVEDIYKSLGLEPIDSTSDVMNVKSYGTLFRVLYNSSLLNRTYSEKALEILAQSEFKYGLKKGIPQNIVLAQKFGERGLLNNLKQLHSCGIVYHPKRPYLICVMTQGSDYNDLSETISEISKLIYEEFTAKVGN